MEAMTQAKAPDATSDSGCVSAANYLASVAGVLHTIGLLRRDAVRSAALMSAGQAAQLAADVEAISRTVDYLQVVCAGALETHRVAGAFGADPARGQWDAALLSPAPGKAPAPAQETAPDAGTVPGSGPETTAWNNTWAAADSPDIRPSPDSPAQREAGKTRAEFRTTADYMRCRLRISRGEAQRRLRLACVLLPAASATGQPVPATLRILAGVAAAGKVSSRSATIIADTVDSVAHRRNDATAEAMEADLSSVATLQDQDFLARTARRWVLLADQDGAEPTEEELRRFQGVFSGRKKNGLHHLSIYCTADQHETLFTVMNAAAGPTASQGYAQSSDGSLPDPGTQSRLDRRTRPQRLLAGLVDTATAALAAGGVPASGGLRPQVMVTIDSATLLQEFDYGSVVKGMDSEIRTIRRQTETAGGTGAGSFAFTGPVAAATVRKLACDAELLPVVLSGTGRILDVGRAQRLFPPHLRKALHARDGGCAFPGCTIPGPWTEAHHIQHWNRGGPTSTDNGVLLCSHHHHEVHKENWKITLASGVPWFVPPPYVDPDRVPLRNTYFRQAAPARAVTGKS